MLTLLYVANFTIFPFEGVASLFNCFITENIVTDGSIC